MSSVSSSSQLQTSALLTNCELCWENSWPCYFSSFTLPLVTAIHFYSVSSIVPLQTSGIRISEKFAWKQGDISHLSSTKFLVKATVHGPSQAWSGLIPVPTAQAAGLASVLFRAFSKQWRFLCQNFEITPNHLKHSRSLEICTGHKKLFGSTQHSGYHNLRYQTSHAFKKKKISSQMLTLFV